MILVPLFLIFKNNNRFAYFNHVRTLKLPGLLPPAPPSTRSTRCFRSGALGFSGLLLCSKRFVLFHQRIARSCHCFEIVSQLSVLFLQLRHLGLQLLVLLQGFCVLAGSQEQTQHYRRAKSRPSVFVRHASSFLHENLNCDRNNQQRVRRGDAASNSDSLMEFLRWRKPINTIREKCFPRGKGAVGTVARGNRENDGHSLLGVAGTYLSNLF
jgi:hypothetical protein